MSQIFKKNLKGTFDACYHCKQSNYKIHSHIMTGFFKIRYLALECFKF